MGTALYRVFSLHLQELLHALIWKSLRSLQILIDLYQMLSESLGLQQDINHKVLQKYFKHWKRLQNSIFIKAKHLQHLKKIVNTYNPSKR